MIKQIANSSTTDLEMLTFYFSKAGINPSSKLA